MKHKTLTSFGIIILSTVCFFIGFAWGVFCK